MTRPRGKCEYGHLCTTCKTVQGVRRKSKLQRPFGRGLKSASQETRMRVATMGGNSHSAHHMAEIGKLGGKATTSHSEAGKLGGAVVAKDPNHMRKLGMLSGVSRRLRKLEGKGTK